MLWRSFIKMGLLFIVLFTHLPFKAFSQRYSLSGKIKGIDEGWVFVMHRQTAIIDSGRISKGAFVVSGNVTDPEFCNFGIWTNGVKDYYFGFFLERGKHILYACKDSLNDRAIIFKGSRVEEEFKQFQKEVNQITQRYQGNQSLNSLKKLARTYALKHPGSYVSAFALNSFESDLPELSKLYARLSVRIQRSYYGRLIQGKVMHH